MPKFNRRSFLQLGVAGIGISLAFLWEKISFSHNEFLKHKTQLLPFNKNKMVAFFKDFIIVNKKDKTTVLSSHCTHLGCTIDKIENGRLVCPCHGSEYDLDGNAIKGPAYKPLENIPSEVSADQQHIQIKT